VSVYYLQTGSCAGYISDRKGKANEDQYCSCEGAEDSLLPSVLHHFM